MRIAVAGGGPGGLYFAALVKQLDPSHQVTVWERNAAEDTFGFGVVFSDETLGGIEHADPQIYARMQEVFACWDDIDIHFRGITHTCGGQGFAAISRKTLLLILQQRCAELGVDVRFRAEAPDVDRLAAGDDLVLAADGANSAIRATHAEVFGPSLERRHCKYMWLGTDKVFESFEFHVRETPYGVMQVHGYPYGRVGSTFLIEMHDDVWDRAGFADIAPDGLLPGESDLASVERVRQLLGDVVGEHAVWVNNSKWTNFVTVRNQTWRSGNIVLLGDAAHTAHFSIGSGTKLAMEDALALAACLHENPSLEAALEAYETERKPVVASTQRAAQASLEWFENLGQYVHQEPPQFAFNILNRSRRITHDNLALRDPEFVDALDRDFAEQEARRGHVDPADGNGDGDAPTPPMFQPYRIGQLRLKNRVVVSPMDMYSATDGVPGDFHLMHLGSKALGGAGMVMTEMVCVSEPGRITPGCTGLYTAEQEQSWERVVDFVHQHSSAKIGIQLGHSGRKGSTKLMWEGIDRPLESGNWEVVAPSPLPYSPENQTPRVLTEPDLDEILDEFVASARAAARAGFDLLELHCAHGYLLSSFLSPLTNRRSDAYGGSLDNRLRYPLRVFDAIRAVWPADRALSVRISATDWADGGNDADDALEIARAFAEHGVHVVHVSTGQVVSDEQPAFGRSYQTPFADRIRNEIGTKYGTTVIAVGALSSYDDVNSVLLAGRADLVALGRPHLYDPHWTLHAAAEQDYAGVQWPNQYAAGSRKPPAGRTDGPRPRLELVRGDEPHTKHQRWTPGVLSTSRG
jgi:anthraniloyl-CoA monooxygenase